MIEYQLKDADNNTYSLNGALVNGSLKKSWTQESDIFEYDNKIIDRSFLPGSSLIGEKRLRSREFTMSLVRSEQDTDDYRTAANELLFWLNKTKYIVDVTNTRQMEITINSAEVSYDPGSLKLSSNDSFSFTALSPYWSDTVVTDETGTATADTIKEQIVTNGGSLNTYPIITLVATIATDDVQIYLTGNNSGIQIQDSAFGTSGNLTMIINCGTGLVSINDLNRNVSIVAGTGFFSLPVGADTVNILSSETITYTIEWYERDYI